MKLSSLINSRRLNEDQVTAVEELIDRGFNTIVDVAIGVGEVGLSMISGAVAEPASGLYGLGSLVFQDLDSATSDIESIQNRMTYEPKTEAGKKGIGYLGSTIGKIGESVDNFSGYLGDKAFDTTGNPALAAAAATLPTAAFEILPTGRAPGTRVLKSNNDAPYLYHPDSYAKSSSVIESLESISTPSDAIQVYHGGTYSGGRVDKSRGQRGGLGDLYGTTDKDAASNYAASGYFDSDDFDPSRGGTLSSFNVSKDDLVDIDKITPEDLVKIIGEDKVLDVIRRESPDIYYDIEMKADSAGVDVVDFVKSDDGFSEIKNFIEDVDPESSFEGPALKNSKVGAFVVNNELSDELLEFYNKKGFIYKDTEIGGSSVALKDGYEPTDFKKF